MGSKQLVCFRIFKSDPSTNFSVLSTLDEGCFVVWLTCEKEAQRLLSAYCEPDAVLSLDMSSCFSCRTAMCHSCQSCRHFTDENTKDQRSRVIFPRPVSGRPGIKPKLSGVLPTVPPAERKGVDRQAHQLALGGRWVSLALSSRHKALPKEQLVGRLASPGAGFPLNFWFLYKSVHIRVSGTEGRGQHIAHAFSLNQQQPGNCIFQVWLDRSFYFALLLAREYPALSQTRCWVAGYIYRVFWIMRSGKHLKRQFTDYRDTTVFFQGNLGKEIGCWTRQRLRFPLSW